MQLDGLLRFLDGPVEISLTQRAALLVAHRVEGNQLGIVVLVAVFLLQTAVDKGLRTIKISVVSGIERVPPTALCGIVLRRTRSRKEDKGS